MGPSCLIWSRKTLHAMLLRYLADITPAGFMLSGSVYDSGSRVGLMWPKCGFQSALHHIKPRQRAPSTPDYFHSGDCIVECIRLQPFICPHDPHGGNCEGELAWGDLSGERFMRSAENRSPSVFRCGRDGAYIEKVVMLH